MKEKITICADSYRDLTNKYHQQYLIACLECNCLCFKSFGDVCHICDGLLIDINWSCVLCTLRYQKQVDK